MRRLVKGLLGSHLVVLWPWDMLEMFRIAGTHRLLVSVSDVGLGVVGSGAWVGRWVFEEFAVLVCVGDGLDLVEVGGFGLVVGGSRDRGQLVGLGDF